MAFPQIDPRWSYVSSGAVNSTSDTAKVLPKRATAVFCGIAARLGFPHPQRLRGARAPATAVAGSRLDAVSAGGTALPHRGSTRPPDRATQSQLHAIPGAGVYTLVGPGAGMRIRKVRSRGLPSAACVAAHDLTSRLDCTPQPLRSACSDPTAACAAQAPPAITEVEIDSMQIQQW